MKIAIEKLLTHPSLVLGEEPNLKGGRWKDGGDRDAHFFMTLEEGLFKVDIDQDVPFVNSRKGSFIVLVHEPEHVCVLEISD